MHSSQKLRHDPAVLSRAARVAPETPSMSVTRPEETAADACGLAVLSFLLVSRRCQPLARALPVAVLLLLGMAGSAAAGCGGQPQARFTTAFTVANAMIGLVVLLARTTPVHGFNGQYFILSGGTCSVKYLTPSSVRPVPSCHRFGRFGDGSCAYILHPSSCRMDSC